MMHPGKMHPGQTREQARSVERATTSGGLHEHNSIKLSLLFQ
jgi:hypothetical protein